MKPLSEIPEGREVTPVGPTPEQMKEMEEVMKALKQLTKGNAEQLKGVLA